MNSNKSIFNSKLISIIAKMTIYEYFEVNNKN